MVMNTQFVNDFSSNSSSNLSSKSSKVSNSESISSKLYTTDNKKNSTISDNKNFNDVLNLKKQSQINKKDNTKSKETTFLNKSDKSSKIDSLKNKVKELKDKIDDIDEKEVSEILAQLLNELNNLLEKSDISEVLNSSDENSILNQLLGNISSNNFKTELDLELLNNMKELVQQLSANLNKDNTEGLNKSMRDIISKLDEMIQDTNTQDKSINTEELLDKNSSNKSSDSNDNSSNMLEKKSNSKEEKFLNSLLDEKNDKIDNQINIFASRIQGVQAHNVEERGLTINKSTFADDLIRDVKFMSTNNIKELTVKVNPGNLGEITIKLTQEDGLMKASLKANSKETTALLSQNLSEIKKELGEQNIKIAEVNIDLYNEDTTFFKNESFGSQLSQEQGNGKSNSRDNVADIENIETEEMITDNAAILDNNLDFLA